MCIIIDRPANHGLTLTTLDRCALENPDGWGLMYSAGGRVVTARGMHYYELEELYTKLPSDLPLSIHFRWRTHGETDLNNTHPYSVLTEENDGRDLWVMHNGIIRTTEIDPKMSDTWHWIQLQMRPMLREMPSVLESKVFLDLIEDSLSGNRLLFLDGDGNRIFLNRHEWTSYQGCLFSNSTVIPRLESPLIRYATKKGKVLTPSLLKAGGEESDPFTDQTESQSFGGRRSSAWDDEGWDWEEELELTARRELEPLSSMHEFEIESLVLEDPERAARLLIAASNL